MSVFNVFSKAKRSMRMILFPQFYGKAKQEEKEIMLTQTIEDLTLVICELAQEVNSLRETMYDAPHFEKKFVENRIRQKVLFHNSAGVRTPFDRILERYCREDRDFLESELNLSEDRVEEILAEIEKVRTYT